MEEELKKHISLIVYPTQGTIEIRGKGVHTKNKMPYFCRLNFLKYPILGIIASYNLQENIEKEEKLFTAAWKSKYYFPTTLPIWLLEHENFYKEAEPLLKVKEPVLGLYKKGTVENIEKYTGIKAGKRKSNIDGRISGMHIIIDARNDEFKKLAEDINFDKNILKIEDTWFTYKRINYPCSYVYQGQDEPSFIVSNKYKQLMKPDLKVATVLTKDFIKNTRYKFSFNNPTGIIGANLKKLYARNYGAADLTIRIFSKSGLELKFWDIKELLSQSGNDAILHKILDTLSKNKNAYLSNKKLYSFNKDEVQRSKQALIDYLIKRELKDFLALLENLGTVGNNKMEITKLHKNPNFTATLQLHQEIGASWLLSLYRKKVPGAILADDMGMGKSIQTIAFLTMIQAQKMNIIIICPASVISVWEKEFKKFNPTMEKNIGSKIKIYSYEKAARMNLTQTDILILDEAQKIKNNKTTLFKGVSNIKKKFVIVLTGTPIENKIDDLFSLLQVLDSSAADLFQVLKRIYGDEHSITTKIREIINPIYLQRKKSKEQLNSSLIINEQFVNTKAEEIKLQKEISRVYGDKLLRIKAKNNHDFYSAQIIMAGIMRLRQAISYPAQLPEDLLVHFKPEMRRKVLNLVPSKVIRLTEIYKDIKQKKEKVVIFAEFTKTVAFLKEHLESNQAKVLTLTGSDSSTKRKILIDEFQDPESNFDVFIISLKAGATGITLTAANNVVIYDLWYNPAVIAQAMARVHRIGQTKDVQAHLMINKDTIDEKIYKIFYNKSELINHFEKQEVGTNLSIQKAVRDIGKELFK